VCGPRLILQHEFRPHLLARRNRVAIDASFESQREVACKTRLPMCHECANVPKNVCFFGSNFEKYSPQLTFVLFGCGFDGNPVRPTRGDTPSRFAFDAASTWSKGF